MNRILILMFFVLSSTGFTANLDDNSWYHFSYEAKVKATKDSKMVNCWRGYFNTILDENDAFSSFRKVSSEKETFLKEIELTPLKCEIFVDYNDNTSYEKAKIVQIDFFMEQWQMVNPDSGAIADETILSSSTNLDLPVDVTVYKKSKPYVVKKQKKEEKREDNAEDYERP